MKRLIAILFILTTFILGQEPTPGKPTDSAQGEGKPPNAPKKKTMEEALKNTKEIAGLVSMHQDTTTGKLFMVINKEQLDKEYIHFVHYLNGTVNAGVFKGWYDDARVIKFRRYFNRVELEIQNNNMYFDKENPLSRSSNANVSTAILGSSQIIAEK